MKCPFCSNLETQVKDSRQSDDGSSIRRRRMCSECGARFTTFERIHLREVTVLKSTGVEVPFDRDKLFKSLQTATKKREINDERIDKIVSSIQRVLETSGEKIIKSSDIGNLVMECLSDLDPVAYVRFASVYKNFQDKTDFDKFLKSLKVLNAVEDEDEISLKDTIKVEEKTVKKTTKKSDGSLF